MIQMWAKASQGRGEPASLALLQWRPGDTLSHETNECRRGLGQSTVQRGSLDPSLRYVPLRLYARRISRIPAAIVSLVCERSSSSGSGVRIRTRTSRPGDFLVEPRRCFFVRERGGGRSHHSHEGERPAASIEHHCACVAEQDVAPDGAGRCGPSEFQGFPGPPRR
jgi:hypothetical protein